MGLYSPGPELGYLQLFYLPKPQQLNGQRLVIPESTSINLLFIDNCINYKNVMSILFRNASIPQRTLLKTTDLESS